MDFLAAARRDGAGEAFAEPAVQVRAIGFPDAVTGLEPREIKVVALEIQPPVIDAENASALFVVRVPTGIEDHAVAGLERRLLVEFVDVFPDLCFAPGERP